MRGRYRILLGMAAGVGKTYRMLQEGRQAQSEGKDVVIGYLEPHDRPQTAALAEGLEVVPRLRLEHGSLEVEEMDVDAVIRRSPEIALVDELAHTNAPGSRATRSATRTSTRSSTPGSTSSRPSTSSTSRASTTPSSSSPAFGFARRFPDRMLDEADEVILVDISPEALQDRLRAGKVYPGGQAERALLNFFRQDNLSALRELALREVAEDVEARRRPRRSRSR